MRLRVAAMLCSAFALCLAACVSPRPLRETSPVRVGFIADLSAAAAAGGADALKGCELRVAEINAGGGIGGRRLELYSQDTRDSPAEAVTAYTQLVQDSGVSVVIGVATGASGMAVGPVTELSKVALLSLGTDDRLAVPDVEPDDPDKAGTPRAFAFLLQASAIQSAQALAWYAVEHLTLNRFATLYDPVSPVSVLQARAFEGAVRRAGKTVAASVPLPAADMAPAAAALGKAGPEAVYVCASVESNAAAARALRQSLPGAMLLGNEAWYAPLATLAGNAADRAWFSMAFSPDDPAVAELAPAFAERFGSAPGPAAAAGWDAVGVVVAAVRKAGTSDPLKVRDALEQATAVKTLMGELDMDRRTHRPLFPSVAIMQVTGGSYRTVDARYVHRPPHS